MQDEANHMPYVVARVETPLMILDIKKVQWEVSGPDINPWRFNTYEAAHEYARTLAKKWTPATLSIYSGARPDSPTAKPAGALLDEVQGFSAGDPGWKEPAKPAQTFTKPDSPLHGTLEWFALLPIRVRATLLESDFLRHQIASLKQSQKRQAEHIEFQRNKINQLIDDLNVANNRETRLTAGVEKLRVEIAALALGDR